MIFPQFPWFTLPKPARERRTRFLGRTIVGQTLPKVIGNRSVPFASPQFGSMEQLDDHFRAGRTLEGEKMRRGLAGRGGVLYI